MALVREQMVLYDGGFFDAEASALDSLGGVEASALFDFGGYAYAYAHDEPAGAYYMPSSARWPVSGTSEFTFDRAGPGRGHGAQEETDCDAWINATDEDEQAAAPAASTIGFDPASGCFSLMQRPGGAARPFGLLIPGNSTGTGSTDAGATPARISQKRTNVVRMQLDAEPRAAKRPCGASRKTTKKKASEPPCTTDPQSITAKNRREKISERLRTLQELVPNGTKVDMVTMLDKAITYVKFLQLQVEVLATDEFWPAQGGVAPEVSQVKEALDAILSSSPSSQKGQRN